MQLNPITLYLGDCLEELKKIPSNSVQLVLCDPPYGTTALKWDSVIPLEALWKELDRILTPTGVVALTCSQPFTTALISSNIKNFRYAWVWEKNLATNFLHAKRQPLRSTEDIVVFYQQTGSYYPIKTTGHKPTQSSKGRSAGKLWHGENVRNCNGGKTERFPQTIIKHIKVVDPKKRVHPTQKPVELMEYLIKTYTLEGETVVDFAMGSCSCGIAAKNLNRVFIGIEKDPEIFETAHYRIHNLTSDF
ncbi:site-specific DNA-methyltransferase [Vibrio coralliirubri]|uniref:DNA-methyltransferase n=1 Tax=Vibrio coralliirubri TaxID=1516159 RepID=UPI0022850352|nr:site-specific DNA-methyltransferase [Vibrio coralliirubri]MCY9864964.1 site-specific DNA-methyltransferase [Vibrio coralliirubri]